MRILIVDAVSGANQVDCAAAASRCVLTVSGASASRSFRAVAREPTDPTHTQVQTAQNTTVNWSAATYSASFLTMKPSDTASDTFVRFQNAYESGAAKTDLPPADDTNVSPSSPSDEQTKIDATTQSYNASAPNAYEPITLDRCRTTPAAFAEGGWVKDHFNYCRVGAISVYRTFAKFVKMQNLATWRTTFVGATSNSTRAIDAHFVYDQKAYSPFAFLLGNFTIAPEFRCTASPQPENCTSVKGVDIPYYQTDTDYANLQTSSSNGSGTNLIATITFKLVTTVKGSKIGTREQGPSDDGGMRCDSAPYVNSGKPGCIFDRTKPYLTYDAAPGSSERDVARHLGLAFTQPKKTVPYGGSTPLPGAAGTATQIHRAPTKPRPAAVANSCEGQYGGTYTGTPERLQCDEYPFNSTQEGPAQTQYPNYWSACVVPGSQNESAGGTLVGYYTRDRILYGDGFQMAITNYDGTNPCRKGP